MNQITKYGLLAGLGICAFVYLGCAAIMLLLVPLAFRMGLRTFSATRDLRDLVTTGEEEPWLRQVYDGARAVQRGAGVGAVAFLGAFAVWCATSA